MKVLGTGPLADPTGARAACLMTKYAAPQYVLGADKGDLFDVPRTAANFADAEKTYPISTKAAAWTSAAAYFDAPEKNEAVGERIRGACHYLGLGDDWARLEAASKAATKQAADPGPVYFALEAEKHYPLDTVDQVKAAADYFHRYADRFDAPDRREFAHGLVKAAGRNPGLFDDVTLWKYEAEAGLGRYGDNWQDELTFRAKRAAAGGLTEVAEMLTKIAADFTQTQGSDIKGLSGERVGTFRNAGELAALLRQVDKRAFGEDFGSPLSGLVGDTPSTAAKKVAGFTRAAGGDLYNVADLDKMPDAVWQDMLGCGPIVSRVKKAEMLADPKKGSAAVRLLADHDVFPVERAIRARVDWKAAAAE